MLTRYSRDISENKIILFSWSLLLVFSIGTMALHDENKKDTSESTRIQPLLISFKCSEKMNRNCAPDSRERVCCIKAPKSLL